MNHLDRFSSVAASYAKFRPVYPVELFEFLLGHVSKRTRAWDVGTGNGQVARVLSQTFERVDATDISREQLSMAPYLPNVHYHVAAAEASGLPDQCMDLITVGQALHWFDLELFSTEVKRVANPASILAVLGYQLLSTTPTVDALIRILYVQILGGYWDPHRDLVDQAYAGIELPFEEIPGGRFQILNEYRADDLLGYLRTWSAVVKFVNQHGTDPVKQIEPGIRAAIGSGTIVVRTPAFLRMWKI